MNTQKPLIPELFNLEASVVASGPLCAQEFRLCHEPSGFVVIRAYTENTDPYFGVIYLDEDSQKPCSRVCCIDDKLIHSDHQDLSQFMNGVTFDCNNGAYDSLHMWKIEQQGGIVMSPEREDSRARIPMQVAGVSMMVDYDGSPDTLFFIAKSKEIIDKLFEFDQNLPQYLFVAMNFVINHLLSRGEIRIGILNSVLNSVTFVSLDNYDWVKKGKGD